MQYQNQLIILFLFEILMIQIKYLILEYRLENNENQILKPLINQFLQL